MHIVKSFWTEKGPVFESSSNKSQSFGVLLHTMDYQLYSHFNILHPTGARWHGQPIFAQAIKVKSDGITNFRFDFGGGCSRGNASRQIGNICRVTAFGLLDNDCVAHATSLRTCLFENTVLRTWSQIVAGLSRSSYPARLARVLELAIEFPAWRSNSNRHLEGGGEFQRPSS